MSSQTYAWERYWCSRSGHINLADGGYLADPDNRWGTVYNPDLVTFSAISQVPCLILLGEPGIGKSQAIGAERDKVTAELKNSQDEILSLDLRSISDTYKLDSRLFKSKKFTDWLNGTHQLHIYLDSFDECLLQIKKLATILIDELSDYSEHIHRLKLRFACRTAVLPPIVEQGLIKLFKEGSVGVYELAPLRRKDVVEAAKVEGIDPVAFLEEIHKKSIVSLAIKPITLKFLLNTYRRYNGQFLNQQRLHTLYLEGCRCLCEETNESRLASDSNGSLDVDQRLIVAARIAAVTIFANRFAIWTGVDRVNVPSEDVQVWRLYTGYEVSNSREFEITESVVKEVLDTGLFSSRGEQRMGWSHQTYAEFLAAWYLMWHHAPASLCVSFFRSPEDPEQKLVPQLHETAAWLASMRSDVLEEIIKSDPSVLLHTDIPTDAALRESLVLNLLRQYEQEIFFDRERSNHHLYWKLKHPRLAEQLCLYMLDRSKQIGARNTAIYIAEACELVELQEVLTNLTLDSSEPINIRVSAAKAVSSVGDASSKTRLKSLALNCSPEDEYNRLKGYCLKAVWHEHLSAQELFDSLTPPQKRNFTGPYEIFLDYELVQELKKNDLSVALSWLEKQGLRYFEHPFDYLGSAILIEAWKYLEDPALSKIFAKIAFIQWKQHQRLITTSLEQKQEFELALLNEDVKRRILLKEIVSLIANADVGVSFLLGSSKEQILSEKDTLWMLDELSNSQSEKEQGKWARLIRWTFNQKNAQVINSIIEATCKSKVLQKEFEFYLGEIVLDSDRARNLKSEYLESQKWDQPNLKKEPLTPLPRERVLLALNRLEDGDLDGWWLLNREMSLKQDSRSYNNEFEPDLTMLPGWQEADESTLHRIVSGAKQYLQRQNQVEIAWVGTNSFNRPALAGCRAFLLLLQKAPEFLETIPSKLWKQWAPVIVAFPCSNQCKDSYLNLVKLTYLKAPSEFTETLLFLIDRDNQQFDHISVLSRIEKCWDKHLKLVILSKAREKLLKPKCMEQLLKELLEHSSIEAEQYIQTFLRSSFPLSFHKSVLVFASSLLVRVQLLRAASLILKNYLAHYERVIVVSKVLFNNANPLSWILIWSAIQQDLDFGKELVEVVSNSSYLSGTRSKLNENQLADLYIWLVHQYPHSGDPDHSNDDMAHTVGTRESVVDLRDRTLMQLKNLGTLDACNEVQRISQEFLQLTWLKKVFLEAQENMRRKTWQPLQPEEVFQLAAKRRNLQGTRIEIGVLDVSDKRTINTGGGGYYESINTGGGDYIQGNYISMNQDLVHAATQIQDLIEQLQSRGITVDAAQAQVAKDVATQAQNNPAMKDKLKKWGQSLGDATISDVVKGVVKLAIRSAGIPLP